MGGNLGRGVTLVPVDSMVGIVKCVCDCVSVNVDSSFLFQCGFFQESLELFHCSFAKEDGE